MSATLTTTSRLVSSIETILRPTFGPCGGDVLVETATGGIITSSDGSALLQSLGIAHPIAKLLVDAALKRKEGHGDGASTLVLMVAAAFREILANVGPRAHANAYSARLAREIGELRRSVLPRIAIPALLSISRSVPFCFESEAVFWQEVTAITNTCLRGKFSSTTCDKLQDMILKACRLQILDIKNPDDMDFWLSDLVKRFRSDLCQEVVGMSFAESQVLCGTLVQVTSNLDLCRAWFRNTTTTTRVQILLVHGEVYPKSSLPTHVTIPSRAGSSDLLNWKQRWCLQISERLRAIVDRTCSEKRSIVLTNSAQVPEEMSSECARRGILLLSITGDQDLERLAWQFDIRPLTWSDLAQNIVTSRCVRTLDDVEIHALGNRTYVLLPPSGCASSEKTKSKSRSCRLHFIISSPSATLCRLYSSAILNCFRTLRAWCSWTGKKICEYQGMGDQKLLVSNVGFVQSLRNDCSEKQYKEQEKHEPLCQKKLVCGEKEEASLSECASCLGSESLLSIPAAGIGECTVSTALVQAKRSVAEEHTRVAYDILIAALQSVPRVLLSSSTSAKPADFLVLLQDFERLRSVKGVAVALDPWTGKLCCGDEISASEPLMSKYFLLSDFCSVMEQLLRIDYAVAVIRKPGLNAKSRMEGDDESGDSDQDAST